MDLGYEGPKYTWSNKQEANSHVKVRLDRAVANGAFSMLFEDCTVENVITTSSDHYAIMINLSKEDRRRGQQPVFFSFRYEAMWRRALDYKEVLELTWTKCSMGNSSLRSTWSTLNQMAPMLKDWGRATFGSVQK
jgi:hypothetical protein